jgi:hypothetical protein
MALTDLLASRLARPAGRVLDAPIRDIVHAVLKEHGYASPAEVQALRDEVRDARSRMDALDRRVGEVVRMVEEVRTEAAAARSRAQEAQAGAQAAAADAARAREEAAAARSAAAATPAPLSAAPRGDCKVDGCSGVIRSKGFCSAHYQQWRRGTLQGYVSQDGLARVGDRTLKLGGQYAGGRLTTAAGRVIVDGRDVAGV